MATGKGLNDTPIPEDFVNRMNVRYGEAWTRELCTALSADPMTSVQINPNKGHGLFEEEDRVPWFPLGRYLKERPVFTLDPLYHAGAYYSQESSSMFLWHALQSLPLNDQTNLRVLDMCAAPGGKSLLLSHFIGQRGVVIANEINKQRNAILVENLIKSGVQNTVVSTAQAADWGEHQELFDVILVDAPCSGEGMFRKDAQARSEWSLANVERCAIRQREILDQLLPALRPGGFLIYSTCTFDDSENEEVLQYVIDQHGYTNYRLVVENEWNIESQDELKPGYRFWPHRVKGEGFFMGVLRAPEHEGARAKLNLRPKILFPEIDRKQRQVITKWFTDDVVFMDGRGLCYREILPLLELNALAQNIYFTMPGAPLGEIKRDDFIPHPALALACNLQLEVDRVELSCNDALTFLRGEVCPIEPGQGWAIAQYQGQSLGWMKRMGARMNNYYPKEWRIRMR
ncbi:MAG: hypothetical protein RLZZ262_1271 [Bacteroidota bacterium]|jgi:16S rRNA C967 or C1407 C5-methylase (RsmB/RsmF family)/NOL1/NOP2/fmu family ribosome biogenesis protein